MGLYFGLEARNRAFKYFSSVHFTENQGHHELVQSLQGWNISLKFLEIDPKLVKIALRVRRCRLPFLTLKVKSGYISALKLLNRAFKYFTSVHFTENLAHHVLV